MNKRPINYLVNIEFHHHHLKRKNERKREDSRKRGGRLLNIDGHYCSFICNDIVPGCEPLLESFGFVQQASIVLYKDG